MNPAVTNEAAFITEYSPTLFTGTFFASSMNVYMLGKISFLAECLVALIALIYLFKGMNFLVLSKIISTNE